MSCAGGVRPELVLEHIVERKRMDDLVGSIIDGRFKEQKVLAALMTVDASLICVSIFIDLKTILASLIYISC